MFTLYPEGGARTLQVPRANGRIDIAITQHTDEPPPELAGTCTKLMFLHIATLSGPAIPVLPLRADTGAEARLSTQFEPIYSRPAQEGVVGGARLTAQPGNTWLVTIGFLADTSHAWTLAVTNTATDADYAYTAIAADSISATQHPWFATTFTSVTCTKIDDEEFTDQKKTGNVSLDPKTHGAYVAVQGGPIVKIVNGNHAAVTTPSDVD